MQTRLDVKRAAYFTLCLVVACTPASELPMVPDVSQWSQPTEEAVSWPNEAGAPIPVPNALRDLDWLADPSAFGHSGPPTTREKAGSFGIGNGRVFGLIGLDEPRNTLTNAIGPGYQINAGFFGDSSIHLLQAGTEAPIEHEQAQRPRRTAIVRTLVASGDLSVETTDVAPPGHDVIMRFITVRNAGFMPVDELALKIALSRGKEEPAAYSVDALLQERGRHKLRIECPNTGATAYPSTMTFPVGTLGPDEEKSFVCWYLFGGAAVPTDSPVDLLSSSRKHTGRMLDEAVKLETPDPKVIDLYEGMLVTLDVQTAENGLVSPMNRYTSGWLRDAEGPIRLLLAAGLIERARTILDVTYRSLVVLHGIVNSFPLDVDISGFEEPVDPKTFWATAEMMGKYEAAEAPSYATLLHDLWIRYSGNESILDAPRMAFLEATLLRQEVSDEGLLPFSGDETFRFPFFSGRGKLPEMEGYSANSSFLLAAAADRLTERGGSPEVAVLGKRVRKAAEEVYWIADDGYYAATASYAHANPTPEPYEDVAMQPLWTGYAKPSEPSQQRNVKTALDRLLTDDTLLHTPGTLTFTGMVPGFLLYNLSLLNHPFVHDAFHALDAVATPSGHFEEGHMPDTSVHSLIHAPNGLGGDAYARYRPWEGGIVVAAMIHYLTGYQPRATSAQMDLAPNLPPGWHETAVRQIRFGNDSFDLQAQRWQEGRVVTISRSANDGRTWRVRLDLRGDKRFSGVWVDGNYVGTSEAVMLHLKPGANLTVVGAY